MNNTEINKRIGRTLRRFRRRARMSQETLAEILELHQAVPSAELSWASSRSRWNSCLRSWIYLGYGFASSASHERKRGGSVADEASVLARKKEGRRRFLVSSRRKLEAMAAASDFPLAHCLPDEIGALFGIAREYPPVVPACVYFLLWRGKVIYVGQSRRLHDRIDAQIRKMRFDRIVFIPVPADRLLATEDKYIKLLNPKFNRTQAWRFGGPEA